MAVLGPLWARSLPWSRVPRFLQSVKICRMTGAPLEPGWLNRCSCRQTISDDVLDGQNALRLPRRVHSALSLTFDLAVLFFTCPCNVVGQARAVWQNVLYRQLGQGPCK